MWGDLINFVVSAAADDQVRSIDVNNPFCVPIIECDVLLRLFCLVQIAFSLWAIMMMLKNYLLSPVQTEINRRNWKHDYFERAWGLPFLCLGLQNHSKIHVIKS